MTPDNRRSGRDSDWTDAESEGLPELHTQPPGITAENAIEGLSLPQDHPLGVDERGTTELEQRRRESEDERAARMRPDRPQAVPDVVGGRLAEGAADPDDGISTPTWQTDDTGGLSSEEAAMHIEGGAAPGEE